MHKIMFMSVELIHLQTTGVMQACQQFVHNFGYDAPFHETPCV